MATAFKGRTWFFDWEADFFVLKRIQTSESMDSIDCFIIWIHKGSIRILSIQNSENHPNQFSFEELWKRSHSPCLGSISWMQKIELKSIIFHFWFDAILYQISPFEITSKRRASETNRWHRLFSVYFFHLVGSIGVIKQASQESNRSIVITVMTLCISTTKPISHLTVAPVIIWIFFIRSLFFTWFSSTFQFDLMCNAI